MKTDILVKPTKIVKGYEIFFTDYNHKGHIFPAVDPYFKDLLFQKDDRGVTIREMLLNPKVEILDYFTDYFGHFEDDPMAFSVSAQTILRFFLQNQENLAMENWFILNTKKLNEPCTLRDIRIVRIKYLKEIAGIKKYWLYCHLYGQWSALGRALLEEKSKFFIPVAYNSNPKSH